MSAIIPQVKYQELKINYNKSFLPAAAMKNSQFMHTSEVGEVFNLAKKQLEDFHTKKNEEFNEFKLKMSQNEVVHIDINPQLKRDIEKCINKSIILENRTCIP